MKKDIVSLVWNEPVFDTMESCINITTSHPRAQRATEEDALVAGSFVVDVRMNDHEVAISLSNNTVIFIHVENDIVNWKLGDQSLFTGVKNDQCETIELQFGELLDVWDREAYRSQIIGSKLILIAATYTWVFLTFTGIGEVMFSCIQSDINDHRYLYFGES